jgi:hypothetical protein
MSNGTPERELPPSSSQVANVPPPPAAFGQARVIIDAIVDELKQDVREIRQDVREIKGYRHTDFLIYASMFAAGFIALAGMFIVGYLKLDDRIRVLNNTSIRVDTKLEDLLQRIPPVPTPPPRRQ